MIEMDCFVLQPGELVIVKDCYFKGLAIGMCIDLGVSLVMPNSLFHRFDGIYQTEYAVLINNDIFFVSEDELLNGIDEGWVEVLPV
jgi:hypothetical protein